jgi:geranylgeranyl diphosphate synthase type II
MSDWESTLDEYGVMIEQRLSHFLENEGTNARAYHDFIGRVYKDITDYVLRGGKRLASCSTLLTYKGFTNDVDDQILDICTGVELYRHAILVHDDLVDRDELRRGASTIHTMYSQYEGQCGEGVAVFTGNILSALASTAITRSGFKTNNVTKVVAILNNAYQAVNDSQLLDLLFERTIPDVDEWYIMASKRAASLFKASLGIGAVLADASERDAQLLEEAALHIGYSFDIQDDIIDTFAGEEEYGRRPGMDLYKHKKPLHIVYTYKMASKAQLETLEHTAHNSSLSNLMIVRKIITDCGALEAAKDQSRGHADVAKQLILRTTMSEGVKNFFISLIDYIKESLNWYK